MYSGIYEFFTMKTKPKKTRYRGIAAVEAAIVFPLLLLLTLGVIEYGWMFLKAEQTTNAARNGARIAIRPGENNASVAAEIDLLMSDAGMGSSGYTITFTPANVTDPLLGETLKVQISVPWANIALMNIPLLPGPANISASVAMAKEGP